MKTKHLHLSLKKFTVASIHAPHTILGAGQSAGCQNNAASKTTSTDDPISQARRECPANTNGIASNNK